MDLRNSQPSSNVDDARQEGTNTFYGFWRSYRAGANVLLDEMRRAFFDPTRSKLADAAKNYITSGGPERDALRAHMHALMTPGEKTREEAALIRYHKEQMKRKGTPP